MNRKSALQMLWIALLLFSFSMSSQAQPADAPPDYRVSADVALSADETIFVIRVTVYNAGGPADQEASVRLVNLRNGEEIAAEESIQVRALGGNGDSEEVTLRVPVERFPSGSSQSLWVTVGVGEVEPETSATVLNNRAGLNLTVPDYANRPPAVQPAAPVPSQPESARPQSPTNTAWVVIIPLIEREINLRDPRAVLPLVGIVAAGLLMLWILSLIVRLLFQRPPTFGSWQPPYATVPPLDPNSIYGRRQLWQQHAQNNALPLPCKDNLVHARKLLMGMDGYYLSGWRFKAARLTQYDMYGRVARSQVFASAGDLKRLNRLSRRASTLDATKLARRLRPMGRSMAKQFKKRLTPRSAMLPIALDVRLQGVHGEVRILFELYQCVQGMLHQVDIWEPEMTVVGRTIQESYTLTIFGQMNTETYRAFKGRIQDDIVRVLVEMLLHQPVSVSTGSTPDTVTQPVQVNSETSAM